VTAWFAGELRRRGWRPAVVMRGYGGDEDQVHKVLNPDVPALVAADRLAGVRRAAAEGADVAVLDDAFQHRALRADAYVVLVAAEEWTERARLLPRGPWREPRAGLSRADLLVITRKTASRERAADVLASAAEWSPAVGRAQVFLKLAGLARYEMRGGALRELAPPRGLSCALAVAGVRSPETVFAQLESAGVRIAKRRSFPDHHRYRASEVAEIAAAAERGPVVTTLKDVVKLRAALPPEADVYVAVQRVEWELGSDAVERLLSDLAERGRGRVTRT
jgi:tetraacyldisaccharide 4'-kinase